MNVSAGALRAGLSRVAERRLLFDLNGRSRRAAELVEHIDRVAGALRSAAPPAPKVGLWYRNSFAAIEAFLAVEWVGGTRVPVDQSAAPAEAQSIFAAAGVDIVLADAEHARALGEGVLVHDDAAPLDGKRFSPIDEIDPERTLMIYPRAVAGGKLFGIPLSYRNWRAIIATNVALFRSACYGAWEEASEVFLSAQQIMHGTGFLGTFPFLEMGLPQVIADIFDLPRLLAAIERHRVTATMLVPAMLKSFIAVPDTASATRSLRHLLYGGGPISAEEVCAAVDRFGPVMTQVYGRVEGGWPLAILAPDDHRALVSTKPQLARSCGRPIAGVEWRLRPLAGEAADLGELLVKSPMTSTEYVGADGWCSLGDVMRRDSDGYLYFERRLDRMINTGYHVYPDEIEAAMAKLPGVRGVRIVGEPHERWGEMVVAYVVPSGELLTEELPAKLQQELLRRLAKYKVPREFRLVSELPPPGEATESA